VGTATAQENKATHSQYQRLSNPATHSRTRTRIKTKVGTATAQENKATGSLEVMGKQQGL
jgi:hypothetical protein